MLINSSKFFLLFSILTLTIFSNFCVAADITAKVDRAQIVENESFQLTLNVGEIKDHPDFSPLKKDFAIVGTSKRFQVSMINGVSQEVREWVITLVPLHLGEITIPGIQVGTEKTVPLKIQVVKEANTSSTTDKKLAPAFLEVTLDKSTAYVQQQINYTVRLYYTTRFATGDLSDPQAKNASIFRLNSQELQVKKEGQLYQVLEYNYAIFPQESGELTIISPEFNGMISEPHKSVDPFDLVLLEQTKPIKLTGQNKVLQVKSSANGLPVKKFTLAESWSLPVEQLSKPLPLGQPITRTITLHAEGLTAPQLPEIIAPALPGMNSYVDKPKNETSVQGNNLLGKRIITVVYIPTEANKKIELPEITIPWWNTESQKEEVAKLPSHTLTTKEEVAGAVNSSQTSPPPSSAISKTSNALAPAATASVSTPAVIAKSDKAEWHLLIWWVAVLFLIAWILTAWAFWRYVRRHNTADKRKSKKGGLPPLYPQ